MKKIFSSALVLIIFTFSAMAQQPQKNPTNTNGLSGTDNTTNSAASAPLTANTTTNSAVSNEYYLVQQYYDRKEMQKLGTYNLSDLQKKQLKTIAEEFDRNINSLNEDKTITSEQLNLKRKEYRNERNKRYRDFLSPQDLENFLVFQSEWNYEYIDWNMHKNDLKLSNEQIEKLNEINNSNMSKELAIVKDEKLSNESRDKKLLTLLEGRKTIYSAVLSADQLTELKLEGDKVKIKTKTGDETQKVKIKEKSAGEKKKE